MLRWIAKLLGLRVWIRDTTSWLAVLGVAIGVANIIALIGVTDSARYQAFAVMRSFGSDTLFVNPYAGEGRGMMQRANAGAFLPTRYLAEVAGSDVDRVAGLMMMPAYIVRGETRRFVTVEGAQPDYPDLRNHHPARGRYFTAAEEAARARVCCLGSALVEPLFGATDPMGQEVEIKGEPFQVVGVMEEKGFSGMESFDERVFIPLSTAQELFDLPGVHTILLRAAPGVQPEAAKKAVEQRLRQAEGLQKGDPDEFSITSVADLTSILDSMLSVFRYLLIGVGSVALLVAGIGIMNVMLMQVIGRTREIGIRRAVGARRRDIWLQFLTEALGQTLAGAVAGLGLGVSLALGFCYWVKWEPHVTGATIGLAVAVGVCAGVVFGVYPAFYAARLKPIDCLRYE